MLDTMTLSLDDAGNCALEGMAIFIEGLFGDAEDLITELSRRIGQLRSEMGFGFTQKITHDLQIALLFERDRHAAGVLITDQLHNG